MVKHLGNPPPSLRRANLASAFAIAMIFAAVTPASANPSGETDVYEVRSYYKNFIPFGVGQFQNGRDGKGKFFLISETVTAMVSVGIFGYLHFKYRQGFVPIGDATTVRNMQRIQTTTAWMFYGLVTWGIIDALVGYIPIVRRPSRAAIGKAKERRSFSVVPVVGHGGVGLAITYGAH